MEKFLGTGGGFSIRDIVHDRELVFELVGRIEKGESFERVLIDLALRRGVIRTRLFIFNKENYHGFIKSIIKTLVYSKEMRMLLTILSMYEKSDLKTFLNHIKCLARLLERQALNRELRMSLERKLLVKISLIAGALSFSTGIVLGALPRILNSVSVRYQVLNPVYTLLLLINVATTFSFSTYFVLKSFQEGALIIKLLPIIIFLIALITYASMIL